MKTFYIHFDVDEHSLKLDTFISTAQQTEKLVRSLNSSFFNSEVELEIIVIPPEAGSFLTKLQFYVFGGIASIITFVETDIGAAYVKGLTGKEPAKIAELLGEETKKLLAPNDEVPEEKSRCITASELIGDIAKGLLENESTHLKKIGINSNHHYDILNARSQFFKACIDNQNVNGIGFVPVHEFPIERKAFGARAENIQKPDEDSKLQSEVVIDTLFVTSPNWDQEDQYHRNWKGKFTSGKNCYFIIEDSDFWIYADKKRLKVEVLDRLKVQWELQIDGKKVKKRRVLRVIELNNEVLNQPLNEDELEQILSKGTETVRTAELFQEDQSSIFEYLKEDRKRIQDFPDVDEDDDPLFRL